MDLSDCENFGSHGFFALEKTYLDNIIVTPPAPARLPLGGWGVNDASVLPVQKFSAFLRKGKTALSQPGRLSGGEKPLER